MFEHMLLSHLEVIALVQPLFHAGYKFQYDEGNKRLCIGPSFYFSRDGMIYKFTSLEELDSRKIREMLI